MKTITIILSILISTNLCIGQAKKNNSEMNSLINTVLKLLKANTYLLPDSNNIFLSANSPEYIKDFVLKPDTLKDINHKKTSEYFILTKEEKKQLLVDTMKWTNISRKEYNLENIEIANIDTIAKIYEPAYLIYKPYFLRNNLFCVVYYDFLCTACGHGTFWLYKKTKKGWKPWIEIGGWAN